MHAHTHIACTYINIYGYTCIFVFNNFVSYYVSVWCTYIHTYIHTYTQSFPLQSESYPLLSKKGAYHFKYVCLYTDIIHTHIIYIYMLCCLFFVFQHFRSLLIYFFPHKENTHTTKKKYVFVVNCCYFSVFSLFIIYIYIHTRNISLILIY